MQNTKSKTSEIHRLDETNDSIFGVSGYGSRSGVYSLYDGFMYGKYGMLDDIWYNDKGVSWKTIGGVSWEFPYPKTSSIDDRNFPHRNKTPYRYGYNTYGATPVQINVESQLKVPQNRKTKQPTAFVVFMLQSFMQLQITLLFSQLLFSQSYVAQRCYHFMQKHIIVKSKF